MLWKWIIAVAALRAVMVSCALAQPLRVPAGREAFNDTPATSGFQIQRGTLVVIVLETNQAAIAIDSRVTSNRIGRTNSVEDGVKKVIPLSRNVAFLATGAGTFITHDITNSLDEIARMLAADWKKDNREIRVEALAHEFKAWTADQLSRLTIADIGFLHGLAAKGGGSNVFQAVFLGMETNAGVRVFEVTCSAIVQTNGGKMDARLSFGVTEEKANGKQRIFFLGSNKVFGDGMNDRSAPLAPLMKELRTSKLLPEPTAASLLAAGLREYGDGPESPVGYPIFVYALDSDGFRQTRKLAKGESVTFIPSEQGK